MFDPFYNQDRITKKEEDLNRLGWEYKKAKKEKNKEKIKELTKEIEKLKKLIE